MIDLSIEFHHGYNDSIQLVDDGITAKWGNVETSVDLLSPCGVEAFIYSPDSTVIGLGNWGSVSGKYGAGIKGRPTLPMNYQIEGFGRQEWTFASMPFGREELYSELEIALNIGTKQTIHGGPAATALAALGALKGRQMIPAIAELARRLGQQSDWYGFPEPLRP